MAFVRVPRRLDKLCSQSNPIPKGGARAENQAQVVEVEAKVSQIVTLVALAEYSQKSEKQMILSDQKPIDYPI